MRAPLLSLGWAALVLAAAWRWRPPPRRARLLLGTLRSRRPEGEERRPRPGPLGQAAARLDGAALAVGSLVRRPTRTGRTEPGDEEAQRRLGRALLAGGLVLFAVPPLAPLAAGLVWALPAVVARRASRRARSDVVRQLPEVVDLLVLGVGAGLTVPLAVAAVGRRAPGQLAAELAAASAEVAMGRCLADALEDVPVRVGEEVRPLVAALVASDRYGAPLLDGLVRLADDVRAQRRRRAEEAARRVPVKLLFPLVLCTLPAFALLTVAPLIAGALRSLRP